MNRFLRTCLAASGLALVLGGAPASAFADNISNISQNITTSGTTLPTLISGLSYILALMFAAMGIVKLKDHVERPSQTPLRESISRFAAGGALFSLPTITEAMLMTIGNGTSMGLGAFSIFDFASSAMSLIPAAASANFNGILTSILTSLKYVPTMLSAIAYLLGLIMTVSGVLKAKEHIDDPTHVAMRESVIRFLIGGSFFALPLIMDVVQETITGGSTTSNVLGDLTTIISGMFGGANCSTNNMMAALGPIGTIIGAATGLGTTNTLGDSICGAMTASSVLPHFMTALAYLFGIVLVIWGLLKIKDHVLNPSGTPLWDGAIRLIAAGAFFALPYVAAAMKNTVFDSLSGLFATFTPTGWTGSTSGGGLDTMMVGFIANIYGPMLFAMNFFGYIAGTALVMVGISRLLKSSQEGPRGPGGLGTMMTFIAGGALLSISPLLGAFTATLFGGDRLTHTMVGLNYTTGMSTTEVAHVTAMVTSLLQFMIVLGFISFARGIFIMRGVAEGNHQASIVAGITHMVGGALAVNLGPMLNVLQTTFGITGYGITFS